MAKVPANSLRRPSTPKLSDANAERVRLEHEAKINELQDLVRALIEAN